MVKKKKYSNRILTLSGEIDSESSTDIIEAIIDLNCQDAAKVAKSQKKEVEPIILIVNSIGGDVYAGFGIISAIENSNAPVHTKCIGTAMSMAFAVLLAGKVRYASKYSTLMYHQINWSAAQESIEYHKQELKEGQRLMKMYDSIVLSRSNVTKEVIDDVKNTRSEWYITPQQALKLGMIDEII
jgi:ATP-dependent Clp protease protease subunit